MAFSQEDLIREVTPNKVIPIREEKDEPVTATLKEISQALDAAEEDTTPYPVVADGNVNVVGDANKTEIQKHTFTVSFRFPKGIIPDEGADEVGETWCLKRVKFPDVYITPRQDLAVLNAVVNVLPFVRNILENGKVEKMSNEEMLVIGATMSNQAIDAMYNLVMRTLGIEEDLGQYITAVSVLRNTAEILRAFPQLANEADGFFE